jgi:hypothetical protein
MFADSTDLETTPRLAPIGKINAAELVSAFESACLADYPDKQMTLQTIRSQGFRAIEVVENPEFYEPYGEFIDTKRNITAYVRTSEVTDVGPGGSSLNFSECRLTAEVSDPEADWAALLQQIDVAGTDITWSRNNPTDGTYLRDETKLRIYINEPRLADRANLPEGTCGELPNCIAWTSADIVVVENP